ncbi:MAG: peptidoglycan-binding protein [Dactylosporangium sp.]|nr:peptidoglycan-binding protein [Dactylosporangium sp.]NNJ62913.1 peptidoglycan-binding protein [Dactylosporangium sp.]
MPNPGQPTIRLGDKGEHVRYAQRGLRRSESQNLVVDGIFGPQTEEQVRDFQQGMSLPVDGIVGPATWNALPDGAPMPILREGSTGPVVASLQQVLTELSNGRWPTPGAADGVFGPLTRKSVVGFQQWGDVAQDGVVGDQTWFVRIDGMMATLESYVGLQYLQR